MKVRIRPIKSTEHSFLSEMLYEALYVPEGAPPFPKTILQVPDISKYIDNWGKQKHDIALVATKGDILIGAIWGRLFLAPLKGYGYVDENTPEISMAIIEEYRGKAIGGSLLTKISKAYREMGVDQISLSVDQNNPALRLYLRHDFSQVNKDHDALTMAKKL